MNVTLVPTEHIQSVWEDVQPFLEASAEYTSGRYTVEDIHKLLTNLGYSLWLTFDDSGIKSAAVTGFITYPQKKVLWLMFLGGKDSDLWLGAGLDVLQRFAFDNGCIAIEAAGRPGWTRVLKDRGFKSLWQAFELPVATAGLGV